MNQHLNLGFGFCKFALDNPDLAAIRGHDNDLSYYTLMGLVLTFAEKLAQHDVTRTSCVAIDPSLNLPATISVLATALLGCRCVSATELARKNHALLGITHTICIDQNRPRDGQMIEFANRHNKLILIEPNWLRPKRNIGLSTIDQYEGYASPNDIWFIAQSSGTTGSKKFIPYTYHLCFDREAKMENTKTIKGKSFLFLFNPLTAFVTSMLSKLQYGGALVLKQNTWADKIDTVIGSPDHVKQFIRRREEKKKPSKIRIVVVGGGKISPQLYQNIQKHFKNVRIGYGSSEAGRTCSLEISTKMKLPNSVGKPFANCLVEITNGEQKLPAGKTGEIRVKTIYQAKGYIGETSNSAFGDGWFFPGDLGYFNEAGDLVISGRNNDVLNIGGAKLNAVQVDETIQATEGVQDGISFQFTDKRGNPSLGILLELTDTNSVAGNITSALNKAGHKASSIVIFVTSTIPRNENGKPMRHMASKRVLDLQPIFQSD